MNLAGLKKTKLLFKNSMLGAIISGSRLVSGFVRGKVTALALGAAGVGVFAQANQLSLFALTLASLSMASGIINRMSVHGDSPEPDAQDKVMSTAFSVQFSLCVLLTLLGVFFSRSISIGILGSADYQIPCIFAVLSVPFSALATGYMQGLFVNPKRYASLASATVWANFVGLGFFIYFVKTQGLKGAFIGLFLNSALLFISYTLHVRKYFSLKLLFRFNFDRDEFKFLIKFASVGLTMSAVSYGSTLLIRSMVLKTLGPASNGLLQVPIALSSYYSPFLTDVLWVQLYPFVSKHRDGIESRAELFSILKYTLTLQTAIAISILVGQEFFIRIAYSNSFLASVPLIPVQLLGDFFFFFMQVFSVYYLGASFFRVNLIAWLLYYCTLSVATLIAIHTLGIYAVPFTYLVVNTISCLLILIVFSRKHSSGLQSIILHSLGCLTALCLAVAIAKNGYPIAARLVPFFVFGIYFYVTAYRTKREVV